MITGEIKQKVDAVWQTFWNNGFTASITILEQMTYLFFMKLLDDKQQKEESNANIFGVALTNPTFKEGDWHNPESDNDVPYSELRWHVFKDMDADKMLRRVRNDAFVFLRHMGDKASAYSKAMQNTVFLITDARMLTKVVDGIDALDMNDTDTNKYSLILANPPFAGSRDADDIAPSLRSMVNTKKTELLFLALFMRMLKTGGRCASIVPDTVLTGDNAAYTTIRKELVDRHCLRAVISMPSGVFQPYSGVSTAIIVFTKTGTGGTDKVWFYDMQHDGFSLTTQRIPQPEQNDIPDLISRFHNQSEETERDRKAQSFFVTANEIRQNVYNLSYKKYHEVEHEAVEYEAITAIGQIKQQNYPAPLKDYTGEVILCGISYEKNEKEYTCMIERIEQKNPRKIINHITLLASF